MTQQDDLPCNDFTRESIELDPNIAEKDPNIRGAKTDCDVAMAPKAVWIASYPKSGNTWVRVFIHNLLRELRGEDGAQSINALREETSREGLTCDFVSRLGKPFHEASSAEIAALRPLVQADLINRKNGLSFVKTHNAVANVEGFPTINFDLTLAAIHVVRNPLDVAISYAHHSGVEINRAIEYMSLTNASSVASSEHVYEFMGSWSFHTASWLSVPHRPVLTLRYEDMLAKPERTFSRLASFLRLKPNSDQLTRAIKNSSFSELAKQEETDGFIESSKKADRFFRSGLSGQWHTQLTRQQVASIIQAHAPMMMRLGYLAESLPTV